ncbi:uncharacterized protein NPIL_661881 [Nephila pilipes]|uniref:PARG helical domain-containing protein n=1 Tax=Nephila pilipes TaxID=299642 RepID=A0A8X6UTD5_NEPPI|nr:uncharacterized protein NPIL_661881 [Nephila pilipes]
MFTSLFYCSVSLDPDDIQRTNQGHPGILELRRFMEEELSEEERTRFLAHTLPRMVSKASNLKRLKPSFGFLYSLRREERRFELDKTLVSSLLANAFFSTFAKRNVKTHPTLQDFRMVHFFTYLQKRGHQNKLRAFLRYFESPDEEGHVTFMRKVLQQGPSLPGWLCSDRPLVPLDVLHEGSVHLAEPGVYRVCPCSPLLGGDVLTQANSKEARLFFTFPELLVILSFVEGLVDDEALIAENAGAQPARSPKPSRRADRENLSSLENDSTTSFFIEDSPQATASQNNLVAISTLPSSSITELISR